MCVYLCIHIYASSYFLNNIAAERSEEGNKFQGAVVKYYPPKTRYTDDDWMPQKEPAAQSARGGDRFGGVEQAADFLLG